PDPYRWLEDDLSEETSEWVKAQNKVTSAYLDNIPFKDKIKNRLTDLYDYQRVSAPVKEGNYIYFSKNEGLQDQSVIYRKTTEEGEEEVFLDPNTFSEDGTVSLAGRSFSKDGSLLAYQISEGGSDWRKVMVMNTETMELVGDTLTNVKFSGISWDGNDGFYYSSYDKPKDGSALSAKTQYHKLYYHKLNTPQSEDQLIFGGQKQPNRYISGSLTADERFLVISGATSTSGNTLFIKDLKNPKAGIIPVIDNYETNTYVVANDDNRLILFTNLDAPKNRLVSVDIANPTPENWEDLIKETDNVLSVNTGGKKIFASYLQDAKTKVLQYNLDGELEREIKLPGIGTANGFSAKEGDTSLYYGFTSFTYPYAIFKYDIATGESSLYKKPDIDFNPDDYVTEQIFYESKDGTKVPMFIVYKKGLEKNGKNPTYLYAYGGFNVSLTPSFSVSRLVWLENGGIYAQPNIRGGGEYGEEWHKAGTKMQKQNVFDDFIAAGEYLIKNKYTSSDYLAIVGGSNGGLLVGATMTQRPELAKVALPRVGVMDMLRYHKFTAGAGWAYDYGTADDSREMFEYLKKYSPVHALKENTSYPATMVMTADHDDRVVPAHSFKFAATLQEKHVGDNPVLIRIETDAGHGSGTPTGKVIDQVADMYSFVWYNMGVVPPIAKKDL
ncbi:MAG: prolyl oligopeptidase family serine peptidase, partial [Cyclobacteriaceae bacterium]